MGNIDVLSILVNVFFAIIGGAISWTIARSTTLKTELSVIVNNATIFKDEIFPGIAIEVNGQNSKVLTKSEVILWNSGFTTIYGSDVVSSNQLRIELPPNSQIYACELKKTTDDDMGFKIKQCTASLNISFDHCKQGQGIKIAILHDSEEAEFEGKLKPKSEIKKYYRQEKTVSPKNRIHIKERVRKLLLVGGMFIYEAVIAFWGVLTIVLLLERLDVIALLLGLGICLCGGGLSGMVFRILQRRIFMEDGPPTLWL